MIDELTQELRSYPRHYTAAHRAADEIDRLRAALKRISELDVPRPVGRTWRLDCVPSKHDQCRHDLRMYEDCYVCIADYASLVLAGQE